MIPYGRQDIRESDIAAIVDVLKSDWLTQGPMGPRFEKAVANYCGAKYSVAANSATSALHIACLALGLGPGDWLWTTPITFVASANCALYCGAGVDFVDIDPRSYNLSSAALEKKLIDAERNGKLPKIVVPVHLCGQSCDMAAIHDLSRRYGFRIIEDAAHAIGGKYQGSPVGSCKYSDITVFSFHPVKLITTGEGGMAVTNDAELAERMILLRSHGITRDEKRMSRPSDGPWYYQQIGLGYNYRMTDFQSALGLSQLARLDEYLVRRHEIAERYDRELRGLPVILPWRDPRVYSAFHLYVIRVSADARRHLFDVLRRHGISANVHYIPVHTQPLYRKRFGFSAGDFPEAESYYKEAISLPMYPGLSEDEQSRVIEVLTDSLS